MSERFWFKIGEAADFVGVSPREIRYWERVIPEIRPRRSKGNLRHFHKDDLPKLRAIAAWIKNGFTVADCRELLTKGSITRDLGLNVEESEELETKTLSEKNSAKPKPKPKHDPDDITTEPMLFINAPSLAQLRGIVDSLKKLLTRLQKPIS